MVAVENNDRYVDFDEGAEELRKIGIPMRPRQLASLARRKLLPFIDGPEVGRRKLVLLSELIAHYRRKQFEALALVRGRGEGEERRLGRRRRPRGLDAT